jgi:Uma2 family endonuclease
MGDIAMRDPAARDLFDPDYPSSDGQPMAENTLQYRWIVTLKGGLDVTVDDFVAGDLLWYPVKGRVDVRVAPDVMVALGRPKGERGSYKQWEEDNVPPAVVIEVLSPGNTPAEMERKLAFYERHGVQEYLVYDPDHGRLELHLRQDERLVRLPTVGGWTSPLLGVTWSLQGKDLIGKRPNGTVFESYEALHARAVAEQRRADAQQALAEAERVRADEQRAFAEAQRIRADEQQARAEAAEAQLQALLASLQTGH